MEFIFKVFEGTGDNKNIIGEPKTYHSLEEVLKEADKRLERYGSYSREDKEDMHKALMWRGYYGIGWTSASFELEVIE